MDGKWFLIPIFLVAIGFFGIGYSYHSLYKTGEEIGGGIAEDVADIVNREVAEVKNELVLTSESLNDRIYQLEEKIRIMELTEYSEMAINLARRIYLEETKVWSEEQNKDD